MKNWLIGSATVVASLALLAVLRVQAQQGTPTVTPAAGAASAATVAAASAAASAATALDDLQRSSRADRYAELGEHGAARGASLYFYKCFVCHNHYAKGGPTLGGLFQRAQLASGAAVSEQSVAAVIRNGAGAMPGYVHTLDEGAVRDLLDYLKAPACCYEADEPSLNPQYRAASRPWNVSDSLRGGARGVVRDAGRRPLDGIKVQLIAPNGVRTTVITDAEGRYEFPAMQPGDYLLRIATPLAWRPFQRDAVRVDGARTLGDIVLERITPPAGALAGALPATAEIAAQLSGAELLWNLPGSNEEKTVFVRTCGIGCHDLKEVLRNRFDEKGWRAVVGWMTNRGSGSVFVVRSPVTTLTADGETIAKWLTRVRGPESKDDAYRPFPRTALSSSKVVITEYELPRQFLSIHHVVGDGRGNIWFSSHRTPYVGRLDPRSGLVQEYRVPDVPGAFPGTYRVTVDARGIVWFSQNWAHQLTRLDPVSGQFRQLTIESKAPVNVSSFGDFALAPDGSVWSNHEPAIVSRIDSTTGKVLRTYPLTRNANSAESLLTRDGRFWAGGGSTMGSNTAMMLDTASGRMYETDSGDFASSAARGGFDRSNNAWFGGHTGTLVELVNGIDQGKGVHLQSFVPPTPYFPYTQFYVALPDRNDEIWSAWLHGRGFLRFNPATSTWRVYDTPEPNAFTRDTWVDNSTNPVTTWYADYQFGTLVRIQPRD